MNAEAIREFAKEEVYPTLAGRYEGREFSRDLWQKMGRAGLFKFLVPKDLGGFGGRPEELVAAIEAFVAGGQDPGLCLSWIVHLLIHTRVIASFGTPGQKEKYLPALISGERVGALAASEPGTGANPVKMRARAVRQDGAFRLDARKIFITNGPVADVVIVLARTGEQPSKENISAFVVEASTPGFRCAQRMELGYLNTSPHGELAFEGCEVPQDCMLGRPGDGHLRISRAVFGWERTLVTSGMAAAFGILLDHTASFLGGVQRTGVGGSEAGESRQAMREELAWFHVQLEALREMGRGLAAEVLRGFELDGRQMERLLFLGGSLNEWWERFVPFFERVSPPRDFPVPILMNDARILKVNLLLRSVQLGRIADSMMARRNG
ncbi:MAG: acyl-CoA dehydrogenase family protein [bacterium]